MGKDQKGRNLGKGLSQRKDGFYIAYQGYGEKKVQRVFKHLEDAKNWLTIHRYQRDIMGVNIKAGHMTVRELLYRWMERHRESIKPRTADAYEKHIRNHILPAIGHLGASETKVYHIENFLYELIQKGYAKDTVITDKAILTMAFDYAIRNEIAYLNPCHTVKLEFLKSPPKQEKRALSEIEIEKFFTGTDNKYLRMCFLSLFTGLRVGEVTGLRWDDVDMSRKVLSVKRSIWKDEKEKRYVVTTPKTVNGIREIPIPPFLAEKLSSWWHDRPKTVSMEYGDLIFRGGRDPAGLGIDVIPVNHSTLTANIKRRCVEVGIKPFTFHILRHTFATGCIESGMEYKAVQEILGHASITTTMRTYVHISGEVLAEEMNKVGDLFTSYKIS